MAKQVLSSYRRDDFSDPDSFLVQMEMVLERYSDAVIITATSPITGIQRVHSAPPSIARVVEFCDREVQRLEKITRYRSMGEVRRLPRPPRECLANLFVPRGAPGFDACVEWAKETSDRYWRWVDGGIEVPLDVWETKRKVGTFKRMTAEELLNLYGRHPSAEREIVDGGERSTVDEAEALPF